MIRPPPSLLTGFPGSDFPAFKRYYEVAKTSRNPSCKLRFLRLTVPSLLSLVLCSCEHQGTPAHRPGAYLPGSPLPVMLRWRLRDIPGFQRTPLCICPALKPRQSHTHQAIAVVRCCPRFIDNEGLHNKTCFVAQSHGFCTHCLRFVPPLLTTTQDSLPVGG